jgi:thiosulfate/3-mercaptopyruvate sulfurtransferase
VNFQTFISPQDLLPLLDRPDIVFVDCRFDLDDPFAGEQAYQEAHIPGAVYAHLEEDLSGPPVWKKTNANPFPAKETFIETLSRFGIDDDVQVLIYDNFWGGIAARLWYMLRWLGHKRVALLDGQWDYWKAMGFPTRPGAESRPRRVFRPSESGIDPIDDFEAIARWEADHWLFLDTRTQRRFTGEVNPTARLTGHIPGARNFTFIDHWDSQGLLLPNEQLRAKYTEILGAIPAEQVICYCTSGVVACLNIAVMQHLGLGLAELYAGSWEGWTLQSDPPVEKSPGAVP